MSDDRIGFHPVGPPQRCQRQLHARPAPVECARSPTPAHHRPTPRAARIRSAQRKPVHLGDRCGERRLIGQQLPTHPGPLRSLTGIHEHRATPSQGRRAERTTPSAGRPPANARNPATACARSAAHTVREPSHAGPGDGYSVCATSANGIDAPGAVHPVRQRPSPRRQPLGVLPDTTNVVTPGCADADRTPAAGPAPAPHARSSRPDRTTIPPHVADPPSAGHGVFSVGTKKRVGDGSIAGFHRVKCRLGGMVSRPHDQHRLDEARDPGRRLQMTEIGLHRPQRTGCIAAVRMSLPAPRIRSDRPARCRCRGSRHSPPCRPRRRLRAARR